MKNKNSRMMKISVNVLMILVLISTLIPIEGISVQFHFIGGVLFTLLFIIHILLNRKWVISVTKAIKNGKINKKTKQKYIVDLFLLIIWSIVVISGIPAIGFAVGEVDRLLVFSIIHVVSSRLGCFLFIVHIIQHRTQIRSYLPKTMVNEGD